jgi:hypothetical protein
MDDDVDEDWRMSVRWLCLSIIIIFKKQLFLYSIGPMHSVSLLVR